MQKINWIKIPVIRTNMVEIGKELMTCEMKPKE